MSKSHEVRRADLCNSMRYNWRAGYRCAYDWLRWAIIMDTDSVMEGALRWTVYGAVACLIGHYTWPTFR